MPKTPKMKIQKLYLPLSGIFWKLTRSLTLDAGFALRVCWSQCSLLKTKPTADRQFQLSRSRDRPIRSPHSSPWNKTKSENKSLEKSEEWKLTERKISWRNLTEVEKVRHLKKQMGPLIFGSVKRFWRAKKHVRKSLVKIRAQCNPESNDDFCSYITVHRTIPKKMLWKIN